MLTIGLGLGLASIAGLSARWCVRRYSHTAKAAHLWWLASALAAVAAMVAVLRSGVPVPAGLAAGGLSAAAVIDAAEERIPTPVAHGTTIVSLIALAGHAAATGEWDPVTRAVLLTSGLVLLLGVMWLASGMGFGDVRFAASLVTAMTSGSAGLVVVVYTAFFLGGGIVLARRLTGRRGGNVPFGPGLAAGWLLAVALT